MAFEPPLRSELSATVLRALRDVNGSVFPPESINDFIALAMADLSSYRPKETAVASVWPIPDPSPFNQMFSSIWAVNVRVDNGGYVSTYEIPFDQSAGSGSHTAGWGFFAGNFGMSDFWAARLDAYDVQGYNLLLLVSGYADRDLPQSDGEVLDLTDSTDYLCVVNHCKAQGFELLTHDRALYQQWLAATNNTDVSPTQLSGMLSLADQSYQKLRARNTKLRRMVSADYISVR